jgi:hypothetical protein
MKTYTDMKDLLRDTDYGLRTIILPHEMYLEEIRTHHSEIFGGLRVFSFRTPKGGVHSIILQAKDDEAYGILTAALKTTKIGYSLLGPKGKPMSAPASSAS